MQAGQKNSILELQNIDHKPIAAIYLDHAQVDHLVVSETNNQERYYLYIDGIGIYFSFYRMLCP